MENKATKKICNGEKKSEDLPEDIICDVFSRLPTTFLMRFRCVSRFHNSVLGLGRDPYFVDLHHQRGCSISNSLSNKFLIRTISRTKLPREENFYYYSLDHKLGKKMSIPLSIEEKLGCVRYPRVEYAKGLFCLWSKNFEPVFIFNPTTRESRYLPRLGMNPEEEDFINLQCHYSLGFDPNLKKHKILMTLYDPKMKSTRHCWVFTLGETTWREINCTTVTNYYPKMNYEGVYIDGSVYFYCGHCNMLGLNIVTFNFRTEEFLIISLWDSYRNCGLRTGRRFNLVELEGKLAAIDSTFKRLTIWILQSPETGEWIMQLEIDNIPRECKVEPEWHYIVYRRCTSSSTDKKEIALMKSKNEPKGILFYDLKDNKWRSKTILGLSENAKIIGIYNYEYCIYSLGQI